MTAAKQKRNRERMRQLRRERAASLDQVAAKMKSKEYDPFKAFRCVMTDEHRELIASGLSDEEKLGLLKVLQDSLKAKQRHAMRLRRARLTPQQREEERKRNRDRKHKTRHDPVIEFRRYMTEEQRKMLMQPDLDPETKNGIVKELSAVRKWVHREQTRKRRSRLSEQQKEDVRRRSREYKRRARSNPLQTFGSVMTEKHYELLQQDLSEQQKEELMQELIELKKAKQREEMRVRRARFSPEQKERERAYSRHYKRSRREKTIADLISATSGSGVLLPYGTHGVPMPAGSNIHMAQGNDIPMPMGSNVPVPHDPNVPMPPGTQSAMPGRTGMPMPTIAVKVKIKPMPGQHFAVQGIERSYAGDETVPVNISPEVPGENSLANKYHAEKEKNRERQRRRRSMQTEAEREEERKKNRERSRMRRRRKAAEEGRAFHPRPPIKIIPQGNGTPKAGGSSSQVTAQPTSTQIKNETEHQYEQANVNNNKSFGHEEHQTPRASQNLLVQTSAGQILSQAPVSQLNGQQTPITSKSEYPTSSSSDGSSQETLNTSTSSSGESMSKESRSEWFSEGMLENVKKKNRSNSQRGRASMSEEQRERERARNRERQRIRRLLQSPQEREQYTVKQRLERRKRREDPAYRARERERQRERKRLMREMPWYKARERSQLNTQKVKHGDQQLSASEVETMIQQYIDGEEVPGQYPGEGTAVIDNVNVPLGVPGIGEGQGGVLYPEPRRRRGRGRGRGRGSGRGRGRGRGNPLVVRVPGVERQVQMRQTPNPALPKTESDQEMYVQSQLQASNTVLSHVLSHPEKTGLTHTPGVVDVGGPGGAMLNFYGSNNSAGVKQEDNSAIFVGMNMSADSEEQENKSMCDNGDVLDGACFRRDIRSKDLEESGTMFVNMNESGWEDMNENQSPDQDRDEENTGEVMSNPYGVHRITPLN